MSKPGFDVMKVATELWEQALKSRGEANILIAGKTGSGKSTLINAVFQGRLAATGQGRPVTQQITRITKTDVPISIYDTRGFELHGPTSLLEELKTFIDITHHSDNPQNHIHAAWLCIGENGRRVEEGEIALAQYLSSKMPVIIVITTAIADHAFRRCVHDHFPFAKNVVRVNSQPLVCDSGHVIPEHGLYDLTNLTMEVLPEGQKKAFIAAQKISLSLKVSQSHKIVTTATTAAMGIAAFPLPFSDALAIVPVHIGMLAGISLAFGLETDKAFLASLVSGSIASISGSIGGPALVGAFLKMIPTVGSLAGAAISAGVAGTLTATFGQTYISVLSRLHEVAPDKTLKSEDVIKAFHQALKNDVEKSKKGRDKK